MGGQPLLPMPQHTIREGSRHYELDLQVTGLAELMAHTLYPPPGT